MARKIIQKPGLTSPGQRLQKKLISQSARAPSGSQLSPPGQKLQKTLKLHPASRAPSYYTPKPQKTPDRIELEAPTLKKLKKLQGGAPGQTPKKPSNRPSSLAAKADKVMKRNPTWNRANVEARIAKQRAKKLKTEKLKTKQSKALKLRSSAGTVKKRKALKLKPNSMAPSWYTPTPTPSPTRPPRRERTRPRGER